MAQKEEFGAFGQMKINDVIVWTKSAYKENLSIAEFWDILKAIEAQYNRDPAYYRDAGVKVCFDDAIMYNVSDYHVGLC
jgi:hypothetical protein